jgi:alkylation response protein AidB-like acyl-CoA dehydrogenase
VPAEYGGADVAAETLAEIFRLLASADASLAQIPQSHFVYVNVLRGQGTREQQAFFFGEVLAGRRFGNAQSEAGTHTLHDPVRWKIQHIGRYVLNGTKLPRHGLLQSVDDHALFRLSRRHRRRSADPMTTH